METTDAAVNAKTTRPCPQCGSTVPVCERYVDWCAACDWNVDPGAPDPRRGRIAAARRRLAQGFGEQLVAGLEQTAGSAPPARDVSTLLALGIALLVHSVTVLLVVGGVLLVVLGWDTGVQPVVGVLLLAIAAVLRPRPGRLPKDALVLYRADAPALFALIDEVGAAVGTHGVHAVVVDAEANASVTTYGPRGRRVMFLGLGLWEILRPQERVALLGHELGHFSHGDVRRAWITAWALNALSVWHYTLAPTPAVKLLDRFVNAATFLPRWGVYGLILLLDRLTLRASLRAEYLADASAARAGSTQGAVGLMDRLLVTESVDAELRRQAVAARMRGGRDGREARLAAEEGLWERLAERIGDFPEREFERLRRVSALRGHCVDSTHPPTHLRRRHAAAAAAGPALVSYDDSRAALLAAELAPARAALARMVISDYAG
ncbi:M48 family metallopeptidase [Streptomyces sp. NBC_00249]|uniref:M48 family metallopeptidase n=1 Tax=Streptomyces sp. NBC_00249 TaxID=2975690 RepID=UPI0022555D46|nr:M48 family metallopeptidase [Streptomyces sp. NBC_00249]MCX5195121.1 M48 family metallopeptidase [Streptomyces sp. NBC_00249]